MRKTKLTEKWGQQISETYLALFFCPHLLSAHTHNDVTTPDHQTPATAERIAWARSGDYREDDANLIIGNREGLIALRDAIDAALAKGEAFVEESEVEFGQIKVCDEAPPDCQEAGKNSVLAVLTCLTLLGGVAVIFVIGCIAVLRFIF